MSSLPVQSPSNELVRLGNVLYQRSLVRRSQELITDPKGQPIGWLLDTRIPMLDGKISREVGIHLAERLKVHRIDQVAGYGLGAYPMVCAVLGAHSTYNCSGGFVRDGRKAYGRQRLVEGPLHRERPVVLLDDILNSGRSAVRALQLLRTDGFEVVGLLTLFNFAWSSGKARMQKEGLWVDTLVDLNLRNGVAGNSSSDSHAG